MKTIITVAIAIAFIFSTQTTAKAGRHDKAIVGGIIGGIIIGSILDNDHHHTKTRVTYSSHNCRDSHSSNCGNYKRVAYQNWVPGHWAVSYDNCGQRRKNFVRGHYEQSFKKVWVSCSNRSNNRNVSHYKNERRSSNNYRESHNNNDRYKKKGKHYDRRNEKRSKKNHHVSR